MVQKAFKQAHFSCGLGLGLNVVRMFVNGWVHLRKEFCV